MNSDALEYVDPGTAFSLAGALHLLIVVVAGAHVVLNKRNEGAAFSWLGIIVLAPFAGGTLYWLFGINRIRRRAQAELSDHSVSLSDASTSQHKAVIDSMPERWQVLMRLGQGVHHADYILGNRVEPLVNGDVAYPVMIQAIEQSQRSVVLSSYIFEYDAAGREFVTALVSAHRRGVEVRVLIDGLGVGYGFSFVRSDRVLRHQGVKTARFLSAFSSSGTRFINLRNHRKILSVDGAVAFVGGLNIRAGNVLESQQTPVLAKSTKHLTQDVHFRVTGPVIDQINAVFAADWQFAAGEVLKLPRWHGEAAGAVSVRALLDGPDDNYQKLQLTMLGAIQLATSRLRIVSPYFLPDKTIWSALHLAVLRGVRVEVCVPSRNNLPFVGWAMRANRKKLLENGIHLYESMPPFDHSKLFVVDDYWCLIGSSNWDSRSLELNFEINLECYDPALNHVLNEIISEKIANAKQVTQCHDHGFLVRLRNNFFRLFSPYL